MGDDIGTDGIVYEIMNKNWADVYCKTIKEGILYIMASQRASDRKHCSISYPLRGNPFCSIVQTFTWEKSNILQSFLSPAASTSLN